MSFFHYVFQKFARLNEKPFLNPEISFQVETAPPPLSTDEVDYNDSFELNAPEANSPIPGAVVEEPLEEAVPVEASRTSSSSSSSSSSEDDENETKDDDDDDDNTQPKEGDEESVQLMSIETEPESPMNEESQA